MMAIAAPGRRREIGQEKRIRTRSRLLVAAARVIAGLGEKKATIEDFIQAANVARGTFYNYYSTKADLLDDLWATVGRDPFKAIGAYCAPIADPAARLGTQVRLVLAYARSHPSWGWLVYALSADAESVNADLMTFPRPDLIFGRSLDRFRFSSLEAASDVAVGVVRRGLNATLAEGRGGDYADELCALLLRGLGISDDEARRIVKISLPDDLAVTVRAPDSPG